MTHADRVREAERAVVEAAVEHRHDDAHTLAGCVDAAVDAAGLLREGE